MRAAARLLLPLALAALLALSLAQLTPHTTKPTKVKAKLSYTMNASDMVNVQLTIQVNNKTVLHVDKDPVTLQWLRAVIATLLYPKFYEPIQKDFTSLVTWKDEDGNTRGLIDTECKGYNPEPWIEVGTGDQANTPTVIKLANLWMRKKVEHWSYFENQTIIHVHYQATFTANSQVSVTEVGLSIKYDGSHYLLVAYYHLDSPIQLNTSDAITVNYDIYIHKQLPFNNNFYRLLVLYMLGYRSVGGTPQQIITINNTPAEGIDTYIDAVDRYYIYDKIKDKIVFWYDPYGFSQVDPISAYMIGDNAGQPTETGYPYDMTVTENVADDSITVTFHLSWDFPSQTTVKGVALLLYNDIELSCSRYNVKGEYILIAYFPLPQPVTVPSNGGLGLEISFTIKAS